MISKPAYLLLQVATLPMAAAVVIATGSVCDAAETKCAVSNGYKVIARERDGAVGSDILARKTADTVVKGPCRYKLQPGDYPVLPKANSSLFLAFQNGLLALDEGTGSDRSLSIVDIAKRAKIVSSLPYADAPPHAFVADTNAMTFWRITTAVKPDQCPASWRTQPDNKSAAKAHGIEEMILDYTAGTKPRSTGRRDCTLTQDDL